LICEFSYVVVVLNHFQDYSKYGANNLASTLQVVIEPRIFGYYRSDPTENDSVEGLRPNARGPGLVTFGVS
jgi:hypothetical protein